MDLNKIKHDKEDEFFKRLFKQFQLDDDEQFKQAITLLPVAIKAMVESKQTRKYLINELLETLKENTELLRVIVSDKEYLVEQGEEKTEILKDYLQSHETAEENLQIYEQNTDVLLGEVVKAKAIKRSEFASETGSKKNQDVRNKSHTFLQQCVNSKPGLSINQLAKMLVDESTKNKIRFGRVIPMSTAKDYARFIKKRLKAESNMVESSTQSNK
jgi:hypothetical protein